MHIFKRSEDLQSFLDEQRKAGLTIGFTPTMGALHEGHIALVEASHAQCDLTVCSIFVNPTQFNNPQDLKNYPRTLESDLEKLYEANCQVVYTPTIDDVYPEGVLPVPKIDLSFAGHVMEADKRPGHYEGVIQVVHRFLRIVRPDVIFMGQKDYQQQLIIAKLIAALHPDVKLQMVATKRDPRGLALSSRNVLLQGEYAEKAIALYDTLKMVHQALPTEYLEELIKLGKSQIEGAGLQVDYLEVANAHSLEPMKSVAPTDQVVICVAAFAGEVRLIDNLIWPEGGL